MKPVYKIETWTAAVKDYTFSNDTAVSGALNDATEIVTKQVVTDGIGTFSFKLPAVKGKSAEYYDIALNDIVKIWFDYDSISGDPLFAGRIYQITGSGKKQNYARVIKGRDYGEILQRRMKPEADWVATGASTIVNQLATELGLGVGEIDADATAETHRIDVDCYEKYFTFLQKVSDYWLNAGTQVKKDFFVDINNNLNWKARPIRTVGVESLPLSKLINYQVLRDMNEVKNKIYVYGQRLKACMNDYDWPTEMATPYEGSTVDVQSASGQKILSVASTVDFSVDDMVYVFYGDRVEENVVDTIQAGVSLTMVNDLANTYPVASGVIVYPGWGPYSASTAIAADGANYVVGVRSTKITGTDGGGWCGAIFKLSEEMNLNHYPTVNFQLRADSPVSGYVRFQDSAGKYAYQVFSSVENDSQFHFFSLQCGRDYAQNWIVEAGFDWAKMWTTEISMYDGTMNYWLDGLYWDGRQFFSTAEDAASIAAYGLRELIYRDTSLASDLDCQKRAEALLFQLKTPPIRLDGATEGNKNILIGDRIPMTIPAENISTVDFDVLEVTHAFMPKPLSWQTGFSMLNTGDLRVLPTATPQQIIRKHLLDQREIGRGIKLQK